MSIKVKSLEKKYGDFEALKGISFEAERGEIVGFLGPNGAGKSTTMRIITSYIDADSGEVEVCGKNIVEASEETRAMIGYLPEHNPLYKEMYVREFLEFIAHIYPVKNATSRIEELIHQTGLTPESNKTIGALSKGYRQRVGLAQALIHDPEVLILDEPTSGLDPNQLVDIRQLIKDLGKDKTVIFSTHIMQEVQALCDRVIIIDQGEIIANDNIETLTHKLSGVTTLYLETLYSIDTKRLAQLPHIDRVEKLSDNGYYVYYKQNQDPREAIFRHLASQDSVIIEMKVEKVNFENVFQQLTAQHSVL